MWDQTGKTFTASSDVLQDVGHAAPGVHGEGAHLKMLIKIIKMTRLRRIFVARKILTRRMMI